MTRRRKDPFAGKENIRHFRLVHRPLGAETVLESEASENKPSFEELFEEYNPSGGVKFFRGEEVLETEEFEEEDNGDESYDFDNDDDGEMVDIDAELDQFAEDYIDIEGEEGVERVKNMISSEEKVGEAAKYGILLDDRDYDYTKHLRRVGITPGAVFIQAPGTKKIAESEKKPRDFFESGEAAEYVEEELDAERSEEAVKANHENARKQYRALLQQVGDDPMLREVIEALEDDRYVSGDFDDELVISLDNLNINEQDNEEEDFFDCDFDEDVDILDEDEEYPEFIPSDALKRQMERIAAKEAEYDELDDILNEYSDDDDDEEEVDYTEDKKKNEIIDIEGESEVDLVAEAEAAEIYKYLREHGKARGTTLYEKKRSSHLPPIHVAISQYAELRRELAVNNDAIIAKYSQEDEEDYKREMRESERIIGEMVKTIDDPVEMEKRVNIETAKYLVKLSESSPAAPMGSFKKIVETTRTVPRKQDPDDSENSESDSEPESEEVKINKGVARSVDETSEEKKARKAKIKAEKREKRVEKKSHK